MKGRKKLIRGKTLTSIRKKQQENSENASISQGGRGIGIKIKQ